MCEEIPNGNIRVFLCINLNHKKELLITKNRDCIDSFFYKFGHSNSLYEK